MFSELLTSPVSHNTGLICPPALPRGEAPPQNMGGAVGGRAPADGPADARPGEAPCAAAFVPGRARSRSAARSTAALLALAIALLAGRALPGAAAQAAQGRAKRLPSCATVL